MNDASLTLRWFLTLARIEGLSFLLLLGVAMPLKYLAGMPLAVKWVGWIHGFLFLAFLVALGSARRTEQWSRSRWITGFAAAVLPFGTFVFERAIQRTTPDPAAKRRT